jgi:hypothetical protein
MKICIKAFENVAELTYFGTAQKISSTFTEKLRTDVGSVC